MKNLPHSRQQTLLAAVTALLVCLLSASSAGQTTTKEPDPWSTLVHETGWLILGSVRTNSDKWDTVPSYTVKGESADGFFPRIARPGDIVEIQQPASIWIQDYRTTGEEKRMRSMADKRISKSDGTDVLLAPGAFVKVEEVTRTAMKDSPSQLVWARVVPWRKPRDKLVASGVR